MTPIPGRISIKFYAINADNLKLDALIPVFHRWIQTHAVKGRLLDVADYKHVVDGPGIILIGHEGDYAFDLSEGRPGLLYTRKRDLPETLPDILSEIFRLALAAARTLESEESLGGLKFDYSEAKITFLDRLNVPNTAESFATIRDDLQDFLSNFYSTGEIALKTAHDDPREAFAVRVGVPVAQAQ
jgi:hypothetical protein